VKVVAGAAPSLRTTIVGVKRILAIATMFVLALGGTAAPAHAQTSVAALNCQHSQGAGSVVSADYVEGPWGRIGAIQLCRSGSYYWAYLVEYEPLPRSSWANAYLYRYDNGVRNGAWSCNSSGGNGYIEPGQTMCWTPRVYASATRITFMATGRDCFATYPNCPTGTVSSGQTARTR
jgi:hypothetical protein